MAESADTILDIRGLRIETTKGVVLVHDVDVTLKRGEVLGLIGESGAGKSTIGLAALAYARAGCHITKGDIRLGDLELRELDHDGRRAVRGARVAYIAQSAAAAFNPALRLIDQVTEAALIHGLMSKEEAATRAVELFRALDLPTPETFGRRFPHQASGGQLQRAMAAMAMICKPDILVLDEPTTALDVTTQIEVLAQLRKLIRDNGTAALYITHDLSVVAQVADRIMVLRHGKLVEQGAAAKILNTPDTDYARALVAERRAAERPEEVGAPHDGLTQFRGAPLLDIQGLTVKYGTSVAVDRSTFTVCPGETVAVVGESGSGKTTLAYSIVGLTPRAGGDLLYRGQSLAPSYRNRPDVQRNCIQLVHQLPDVALNPRQTLGSIIGRPIQFILGRTARDAHKRVLEILDMVGLPRDFTDRRPGQLSGGQKQRVCIARALAAEPELVICDEVTSALDPLVAEEILKLLRQLQEELKVSYLFITHDLGTVKRIAHRVVVMLQGEMVAEGPMTDVFENNPHPYTAKLLASVPEMRADWLDEALARRGVRL